MKTFEQTNNRIVGIRRFASLIAPVIAFALVVAPGSVSANPKPTTGTDEITGPQQLMRAGWKLPHPPYPIVARYHREEGLIYIVMTTDAKGKIARISIPANPRSAESKALQGNTLNFAKSNWSGPPNATAKTEIEYRLR